ncbi:ABC transporter substrate-binding protein [Kitasatospora azatica]|uniref:ABC transporter substrate-binding protein n=1 Tax=Kitasatospora azatica TaxID=58347 RepID=UPI000A7457E5|nr:ABC transporter substrate-binding protein [Kitasatospora azatica]
MQRNNAERALDRNRPGESDPGRRAFLARTLGLGGLLVAGGPLLAACGSSGPASSTAASGAASGKPSLGTAALRLGWVKNVEFAGSYLADSKGYYAAEGFSKVTLVPGGPSAPSAEADVSGGKALLGLTSPDITGAAILKGAKLKVVAAQYQANPYAILSMASNPIAKPEDMYGKKIGVQAINESIWNAFLKAAKLDASKITKVPVQFDPTPLTQGQVDGWFSYITNEPNTLRAKGLNVVTFALADHDYPMVSSVYIATEEAIKTKREAIKALLRAEIRGWKDNITDPVAGAKLAVGTYGKDLGLDEAEQTLESKSENALIVTADTTKNGIFTVTDDLVAKSIATLKIAGVDITSAQLFDLSLINEIYKADPSLI